MADADSPGGEPAGGRRKPVLLLGIGNTLLKDEGVGIHVIEALRQVELPDFVELLDGGTAGARLVDEIAGRRKVIAVDAMESGESPGTVYRLAAEDLLEEDGQAVSLHEFGLRETLLMAKQLGCAPAEVVIFGVEPKEIGPGLELTDEVRAVVPRLIEVILEELRG